jgi:hypothetical protein
MAAEAPQVALTDPLLLLVLLVLLLALLTTQIPLL